MNLIWKLLRQHISIPQFTGFFFANLFGMFIVLFGLQFYKDILPVFTSEDSFLKSDYVIVSKKIGTANTLSSSANTFSQSEYDDFAGQPFVRRMGQFTSSDYKVEVSMGVNGTNILNSEMFFESVPDAFIDVPLSQWKYTPGDKTIPIILPRSYITMYNFGFAQSHSLPKISEGLVSMIDFRIFIHGNGHDGQFRGRVIGFSNRLSSILVPQTFMKWSNEAFSSSRGEDRPTRLIVEVKDPTDSSLSSYAEDQGYDISDNNMDAERITTFLKLLVTIVVIVGLVISALSFYILMLSIYLLVQKNATKLENLLLIGYSPSRVSAPYQWLTLALNVAVLLIAWAAIAAVRGVYMSVLQSMFPSLDDGSLLPMFGFGIALFVLVSIINIAVIRRKVLRIWKHKD